MNASNNFIEIFHNANAKGLAAGRDCRPSPMGVRSGSGLVEVVRDGVCGFAWVEFKGNTAFGRAMKKAGLARKAYPTGLSVWISEHSQSYERKMEHARVLAAELRAHGIEAHAGGRLD